MSEMIERVAKAIVEKLNEIEGGGTSWDEAGHEMKESMFPLARAVIEAMRDPTTAMLEAEPEDDGEFSKENSIFHARQFWQAMIDEALAIPSQDRGTI